MLYRWTLTGENSTGYERTPAMILLRVGWQEEGRLHVTAETPEECTT